MYQEYQAERGHAIPIHVAVTHVAEMCLVASSVAAPQAVMEIHVKDVYVEIISSTIAPDKHAV